MASTDQLIHEALAAAVRLHQGGNLEGAETAYLQILNWSPQHPDALHLLGVLDHQRGRNELAVARIGQALAIEPLRPDFHNNLGVALKALGQIDEAIASYREALRLQPNYADALANLGVALHVQGRLDEALAPLEAALTIAPGHVGALFALGNLDLELGQVDPAIGHLRRAHELAPGRADILNNLGTALQRAGRPEEGLEAYRRAAAANPNDPAALVNLATALEQQDHVEEAAEVFAAVARLRPSESFWPIRIAALCPAIFPDVSAIDRYRIGLEAVLDAHRAGIRLAPEAAVGSGLRPSFNLAHHGRNDRTLRAKFAALFRDTFPAREPFPPAEGPPRIGFVVTRHREGGFLRGTAGIIDGLDREQFRITVFGAAGGLPFLRSGIRRQDVEFVALPDDLPASGDRIAAARCDLLYHWQIGADPSSYFLPFTQPAPTQCTSWGTHVTTGIPQVAYYLSSDLIEPPGAEDHYTEILVRMATLPTYQRPLSRPDPPVRRSEFGLPEGRHLYTCFQRLAKLHPDIDPLLAGVLRRDRSGLVLLLEDFALRTTERLRSRLSVTIPDVANRVLFVQRQSYTAYLRLLSLSDVVLDPPHYGAGLTSFDILGLGLPLVTWPDVLHIGRFAFGCYRKLGVTDLIAESPEAYVDLAVQTAMDREVRADLSRRISVASPTLFEDSEACRGCASFFERAVASPQAARPPEEHAFRA